MLMAYCGGYFGSSSTSTLKNYEAQCQVREYIIQLPLNTHTHTHTAEVEAQKHRAPFEAK